MTVYCRSWALAARIWRAALPLRKSHRRVSTSFERVTHTTSIGNRFALPIGDMDSLTAMAASGMRSRMESLDLLANNIANASTGGYKADREFYSLYAGRG